MRIDPRGLNADLHGSPDTVVVTLDRELLIPQINRVAARGTLGSTGLAVLPRFLDTGIALVHYPDTRPLCVRRFRR